MRIAGIRTLLIAIALVQCATSAQAETWHTSKIKNVYPLADGSIVLIFVEDAPGCTGGVSDKYHHIRAGEFGVTVEGLRIMAATVLMAQAADKRISVLFDETSTSCYINRLLTRD